MIDEGLSAHRKICDSYLLPTFYLLTHMELSQIVLMIFSRPLLLYLYHLSALMARTEGKWRIAKPTIEHELHNGAYARKTFT